MPARQCSKVDLPEPLGPMMARISPRFTPTVAPRSAGVWPNDFSTSLASMIIVLPPGRVRSAGRGVVDPAQVRFEVIQPMVGEQRVDHVAVLFELGELTHPLQVRA